MQEGDVGRIEEALSNVAEKWPILLLILAIAHMHAKC